MTGVGPIRVVLLGDPSAATFVSSGTSIPVNIESIAAPSVWVRSNGGTISAGVLTIEEADYEPGYAAPYNGTWSLISTIDLTTLTGATKQTVTHLQVSGYGIIRVRLSTTVTGGGGVNVVLRGRP